MERPFYGEFAWAYDLIVPGRPGAWADMVVSTLAADGRRPGRVLDAGCGTGSLAIELAARGAGVIGVDRSPALLREAAAKAARAGVRLHLAVADLQDLPLAWLLDAALCRGVLNDVLEDDARARVLGDIARVLRPGGFLILDVRDWQASAARYARSPVVERSIPLADGTLTFRSHTALDPAGQRLLVQERHAVERDGRKAHVEFAFTMRCWSREELTARLVGAGFARPVFLEAGTPAPEDRIVATAVRE